VSKLLTVEVPSPGRSMQVVPETIDRDEISKFPSNTTNQVLAKELLPILEKLIASDELDLQIEWSERSGGLTILSYKEVKRRQLDEGDDFNVRRMKRVILRRFRDMDQFVLWDAADLIYRLDFDD
jgi:hypothetical protein